MDSNIVTLKSKSGNKEWFNICFHNTIDSDFINRILVTQSIEYKVDDNDWQTFITYYNSYIYRTVVYGYQVSIRNYEMIPDINNSAYNVVTPDISYITVKSDAEYNTYGNVFMPGLKNIEINEIDDMTAQELLAEIENLKNEVQILRQQINTNDNNDNNWHGGSSLNNYINQKDFVTYNTINLYATKNWVEGKNYLTTHQDLSSYATKSYVLDKVNSINPITYEVSYNVNDIDLDPYATKSYVLDKVNSINPITYKVSYNVNDIDLDPYATKSYVLDKVNSINQVTYTIQPGNGLYNDPVDTNIVKMYIEGNSIKSEEGTGLYVDTSNIIDNDTIQVYNDDIVPGRPNTGRFKVITGNLDKANNKRWGIIRPDENTTYIGDFNPNDADLDDLRLIVNTQALETVHDGDDYYVTEEIDEETGTVYNVSHGTPKRNGIIKYNSQIFRTIKANNGHLEVLTYNLEKADGGEDKWGVVKGDEHTINAIGGILSVDTQGLDHATNNTYGTVKVDDKTILSNNGIISINTSNLNYLTEHQSLDGYATESYVLDKVNSINQMSSDITDLENRTIKLEIEAFSEKIDFLYLINGDYYELPQPVYDPLTYTVINTSLDKTISCQIKTNCKYKVDIEYKENSNKYNQVTLKSVQVGDSEIIPGNLLDETEFEETSKTVQTLYFTFNVKNYNINDNTESTNTKIIITATSINDAAIYQTIKYTFKCWNNNAFDGIIQDSYATESYVGSYIESKNYATKSYVLDKINSINPILYNISYISSEVDLTNYATEEYVQSYIESKNYLTEHQSLNDYATKTFVQEQLEHVTQDTYVTRVSYNTYQADLTNYATKSYVGDYFTDHINNYATKSYVVSYLESQHYLTEHQNIEYLASQSYVNSYVSSYIDLYMSLNNYINDTQINNYATKTYVLNKVSQYPTYTYLNNLINGIGTYNISYQLDNNSVIDLSDYVSKSYFNNIVAQLTEDINDLIDVKDWRGTLFRSPISTELKSISLYTVNQLSNLDLQSLCSINNLNLIELYEIEPIYLYGRISRLHYIDTLYAQNSTYQIIISSVEHFESLDNTYIYLVCNDEYHRYPHEAGSGPAPGVISNNTMITSCVEGGWGDTRTFKSGYDNFILCTYNYDPSELPNYKDYLGGIVVENSYITYLFVPYYEDMSNNELESMVSMYNTWLNSSEMESFINDNKYINLYLNHNAISSNDFAQHDITEVIQEIAAIYNPEFEFGPTEEVIEEPNN